MFRRLDLKAFLTAGFAVWGLWAVLAWACGPFFPNRLLVSGDEAVLWAPVADFRTEIERLAPREKTPFPFLAPPREYQDFLYAQQTADADCADLKAALNELKVSPERRETLLAQHEKLRAVLRIHADARENWKRYRAGPNEPPPQLPPVAELDGLPKEFAEYLRGAVAYHRGEMETARAAWQGLLALPAAERRYRSTWAAFMLGKAWLETDPAKAVAQFEQVRALAQAGFADSLGLAAASFGWQAQIELNRRHFEPAVELYLQQLAARDPTAVWSLRIVAARIVKQGGDILRRVAGHAPTRRVVTAYFLARGGPRQWPEEPAADSQVEQWLGAVEAANIAGVDGADRLAWAAYQAGKMDATQRWLGRARPDSPITHWLQAKLLLRAGQVEQAAEQLALASRAFPPDEAWDDLTYDSFPLDAADLPLVPAQQTLGELGVLRLARRQYAEALDALLRAGFWMDAAYVAERVLTPEELKKYVDQHWKGVAVKPDSAAASRPYTADPVRADEIDVRIRHLLARRLARGGRWREAEAYYPAECRAAFDAYVRALEIGDNAGRPKVERAAALWQTARLARERGMELFGSEVEPDWFCLDGNFELSAFGDVRAKFVSEKLNRASAEELARARRYAVEPAKRWHYRYRAADLAWTAAQLMPDESAETARVLCAGGTWIKALDEKKADRFYKALVRRCGTTELGREADRLRWFPKLPEADGPE